MCNEPNELPTTQAEIEERLEAVLECERCIDDLGRTRDEHLAVIAKVLDLPRKKDGVPQSQKLSCGNYLIDVNGHFGFPCTQLRIERIERAEVKCNDTPEQQPAHVG